jgi:hypothetical protein
MNSFKGFVHEMQQIALAVPMPMPNDLQIIPIPIPTQNGKKDTHEHLSKLLNPLSITTRL